MQGEVEDVQGADQGTLDQQAQFLDQMGLGRDRRNRHPRRAHQQPGPGKAVEPVQRCGNVIRKTNGCSLATKKVTRAS